MNDTFEIKPTTVADVPLIFSFIKELAEYEKLLDSVVATEEILTKTWKILTFPAISRVEF